MWNYTSGARETNHYHLVYGSGFEDVYFDKKTGVLVQFEIGDASDPYGDTNWDMFTLRNSTVFTDIPLSTASPTRNPTITSSPTNTIVPTITPTINEFPSTLSITIVITASLLGIVVIKRKQTKRRLC